MAVQLAKKGVSVNLAKSLNNVLIGLGWDTANNGGYDFDLDASVFLVDKNDKVTEDEDFVFYNNLMHPSKSVEHTGDNRTGEGEGDDESIRVDLRKVPAHIEKIVVTVTIHDAKKRAQNFGQVSNAFIRLVDESTGAETLRYDLAETFSTETALIFAEIYRNGRGWDFIAKGEGSTEDLFSLCRKYGVNV